MLDRELKNTKKHFVVLYVTALASMMSAGIFAANVIKLQQDKNTENTERVERTRRNLASGTYGMISGLCLVGAAQCMRAANMRKKNLKSK